MTKISKTLNRMIKKSLFAVFALTIFLVPTVGFAAEREGSVLFFSLEDLQEMVSNPSLPSFSQMSPSFSWNDLRTQDDQGSPIERNYNWGNRLGVDGYAKPGTRPLWGN